MKKTKKIVPSKGITDRPDVALKRLSEDAYIAKVNRPQFNDREAYVKRAFAAGAELKDIVRNSGLRVESIYKIIGLDVMADKARFEALCDYKNTLIMKAR